MKFTKDEKKITCDRLYNWYEILCNPIYKNDLEKKLNIKDITYNKDNCISLRDEINDFCNKEVYKLE